MHCPLCRTEIDALDHLVNPYWQPDALALARKLNPAWEESEGACRRCFDLLAEQVAELQQPKPKPTGQGLADGYWHVLTAQESRLWNHGNPDMAKVQQQGILDRLECEAIAEGFATWYIFDADERLLAQGTTNGKD